MKKVNNEHLICGITYFGEIIKDIDISIDDTADFDFGVFYDIKKSYYYLEFETLLRFDNKEKCKQYIINCSNILKEYMIENNLNIDEELDLYDVFTTGVNVNTEFKSLSRLYAYMKFVTNGFSGEGI